MLVLVRRSCEKLNRDEYCTCSGNTLSLQGVEWRIHGGQECCQKGKFSEQGSIETVTAIVVNKFKRVPFRSSERNSRERASQDSVSCQTSHVPSPSIDRWADIFLLVRNTTGMEGQSGEIRFLTASLALKKPETKQSSFRHPLHRPDWVHLAKGKIKWSSRGWWQDEKRANQ